MTMVKGRERRHGAPSTRPTTVLMILSLIAIVLFSAASLSSVAATANNVILARATNSEWTDYNAGWLWLNQTNGHDVAPPTSGDIEVAIPNGAWVQVNADTVLQLSITTLTINAGGKLRIYASSTGSYVTFSNGALQGSLELIDNMFTPSLLNYIGIESGGTGLSIVGGDGFMLAPQLITNGATNVNINVDGGTLYLGRQFKQLAPYTYITTTKISVMYMIGTNAPATLIGNINGALTFADTVHIHGSWIFVTTATDTLSIMGDTMFNGTATATPPTVYFHAPPSLGTATITNVELVIAPDYTPAADALLLSGTPYLSTGSVMIWATPSSVTCATVFPISAADCTLNIIDGGLFWLYDTANGTSDSYHLQLGTWIHVMSGGTLMMNSSFTDPLAVSWVNTTLVMEDEAQITIDDGASWFIQPQLSTLLSIQYAVTSTGARITIDGYLEITTASTAASTVYPRTRVEIATQDINDWKGITTDSATARLLITNGVWVYWHTAAGSSTPTGHRGSWSIEYNSTIIFDCLPLGGGNHEFWSQGSTVGSYTGTGGNVIIGTINAAATQSAANMIDFGGVEFTGQGLNIDVKHTSRMTFVYLTPPLVALTLSHGCTMTIYAPIVIRGSNPTVNMIWKITTGAQLIISGNAPVGNQMPDGYIKMMSFQLINSGGFITHAFLPAYGVWMGQFSAGGLSSVIINELGGVITMVENAIWLWDQTHVYAGKGMPHILNNGSTINFNGQGVASHQIGWTNINGGLISFTCGDRFSTNASVLVNRDATIQVVSRILQWVDVVSFTMNATRDPTSQLWFVYQTPSSYAKIYLTGDSGRHDNHVIVLSTKSILWTLDPFSYFQYNLAKNWIEMSDVSNSRLEIVFPGGRSSENASSWYEVVDNPSDTYFDQPLSYIGAPTDTYKQFGHQSYIRDSPFKNCSENYYFDRSVLSCTACPHPSFYAPANSSGIDSCTCISGSFLCNTNDVNQGCCPCPVASWKSDYGRHECTYCPANSLPSNTMTNNINGFNLCICQHGYQYNAANMSCDACAIGWYKDTNSSNSDICIQCDALQSTVGTGSTKPGDCACIPGYSYSGSCSPCSIGYYKSGVANIGCTACPYPAQQTTNVTSAASSIDQCVCYPGLELLPGGSAADGCQPCINQYKDHNGNDACQYCTSGISYGSGLTTCSGCSAGQYLVQDTVPRCEYCSAGRWSDNTNSYNLTQCAHACRTNSNTNNRPMGGVGAESSLQCECNPGFASESLTDPNAKCILCATSTYKPLTGNGNCTACPAHSGSTFTGSVSIADCYCDIGYHGDPSTGVECQPCDYGTYADTRGQTQCVPCLYPGMNTTAIGSTSSSDCVCATNQWKNVTTGECIACTGNSTSPFGSITASACECLPGYFYNSVQHTCVACARGSYKMDQGNHGCSGCQLPFTTANRGSTTREQCVCAAGNFHNTTDGCSPCSFGTYQSTATNHTSCVSCAADTTTFLIGASSIDSCIQCPPGRRVNVTIPGVSQACVVCATGEYQTVFNASPTCLQCSVNETSTAVTGSTSCKCLESYTRNSLSQRCELNEPTFNTTSIVVPVCAADYWLRTTAGPTYQCMACAANQTTNGVTNVTSPLACRCINGWIPSVNASIAALSTNNHLQCTPCGMNMYRSIVNESLSNDVTLGSYLVQPTCLSCPVNTTTNGLIGRNTIRSCICNEALGLTGPRGGPCTPIVKVDEVIAAGTGEGIGTGISVAVTSVTVVSAATAAVTSVSAGASAAAVTSAATTAVTASTSASAGAAGAAAGASGSSSAFSALGASPSITAFLMIGHAQFVTIQSQLGGAVPDWFRSFGSSFAWMSGFGSSLQLQSMADKVRSSLNAEADEIFTDDQGNRQQRRLLAAATDDDADDGATEEDENSITKFANALDVDVSNLFLATFFLFWILLIALQLLGLVLYGLRACCAGSCCCKTTVFGYTERKEHAWRFRGWSLTLFNLAFYGLAMVSCFQVSIRPSDASAILAIAWLMLLIGLITFPILVFIRIVRYYRLRHGTGEGTTPPRKHVALIALRRGSSKGDMSQEEQKKYWRLLRFTTTYQFAIQDYSIRGYWFGTVVLLQQLLVAMFVTFLRFNESAQVGCTLATYIAFAVFIWWLKPFEDAHINYIQIVLAILRAVLLILSASFVGASSSSATGIAVTLLVIHIGVFVLFAYVSLNRLYQQCCVQRKLVNAKDKDAPSLPVELVVTKSSTKSTLLPDTNASSDGDAFATTSPPTPTS